MRKYISLLVFCFAVASGSPAQQRIVGGSVTDISQYPFIAGMLYVVGSASMQVCGGTIINNRSVLSATHCFNYPNVNNYGIRVGSTFASSGGVVHQVSHVIHHPNYNPITIDNDIGLLRVTSAFSFGNNVQVLPIAGPTYNLADNQSVWAAGWGLTSFVGQPSEQLRHVQLQTVNQDECNRLYPSLTITANMLCAGQPNGSVCSRDSGGPLVHNRVLVGVTSFGVQCGETNVPPGFARVSRYTDWITANA